MKKIITLISIAMLAISASSFAGTTPSTEGAKVYFLNLEDGDIVSSPVKVVFGLSGMGVAPAGANRKNTGHHHLLIDRPAIGKGKKGTAEFNNTIPADDHHKHFGGGQTETTIKLKPGKHTLQMLLGDWVHMPHDKPITSDVITITVK